MPAPSPNTSFTTSRTSRSTVSGANLDTSEDELARNEVTPVKRLRPSKALPARNGSVYRRDGRIAFETPMAISRAPLNSPKITTSTSRLGRPSLKESISIQPAIYTQNGPNRSFTQTPSNPFRQSQGVQDSVGRRQSRPIVEVSSKRMHHDNQPGWCFKHQGKSTFVADSQWTYREQDGRPALYCARLNVLTYLLAAKKRR